MSAALPAAEGATPLVALHDVAKRFANGTQALAGLDIAIGRHEFLSLLGPSGCGKSTALRLIAGLTAPSRGRIDWPQGEALGDIGFVFQEPTLMPWASVFDNVRLPLRLQGRSRQACEAVVRAQLAAVGLADFERAYPAQLSGGMKMRASMARALVTQPAAPAEHRRRGMVDQHRGDGGRRPVPDPANTQCPVGHTAGLAQARNRRAILDGRWPIGQNDGAGSRNLVGHIKKVLDRYGQPSEGSRCNSRRLGRLARQGFQVRDEARGHRERGGEGDRSSAAHQ